MTPILIKGLIDYLKKKTYKCVFLQSYDKNFENSGTLLAKITLFTYFCRFNNKMTEHEYKTEKIYLARRRNS